MASHCCTASDIVISTSSNTTRSKSSSSNSSSSSNTSRHHRYHPPHFYSLVFILCLFWSGSRLIYESVSIQQRQQQQREIIEVEEGPVGVVTVSRGDNHPLQQVAHQQVRESTSNNNEKKRYKKKWYPTLDWVKDCEKRQRKEQQRQIKQHEQQMKRQQQKQRGRRRKESQQQDENDFSLGPFHVMWKMYRLGDCLKGCLDCEKSMVRLVGENSTDRSIQRMLDEQYNLTGLVIGDESMKGLAIRKQGTTTTATTTDADIVLNHNMDRSTSFAGRYFWGHCVHYADMPYKKGPLLKNLTFVRDNLFVWAAKQQQQQQQRTGMTGGYIIPPSNAIVLHLRLGDVIEKSQDSVVKMLYRGGHPHHRAVFANSIKNVSEYLDNIREAETMLQQQNVIQNGTTTTTTPTALKVVIRGGSHVPDLYMKSRRYATCIKEAIIEAGYDDVEMVIDGQNPDHDFYYMSHAQYYVAAVGGYGRMIGEMVKLLGGRVLGRVF